MDRIFLRALTISFLGHLLLFFPWSNIKDRFPPHPFSEIEINYFEIKPVMKEEIKVSQANSIKEEVKEEIKEEKPPQVSPKEEKVPSPITKEEEQVKKDFSTLSKEPTFLDYYRAIREKIKISAYRHKPLFFRPGEVCVFFVLDKGGNLRRLKIIEYRSTSDSLLQKTALRSVEDASPFPPFPPELKREQIAFSIIIAFEVH